MIRDLAPSDTDDVLEMFLLSMNWRGPRVWTLAAVLDDPHVRRYVERWGERDGDSGVVAVDGAGRVIGAAWMRRFTADEPGYGYVADDVPELGLAVAEDARGRGLGTRLLTALLDRGRVVGLRGVSLSVEDENDGARRLYVDAGFRTVGRVGDSDTMLLEFAAAP